MPIIQSAKKRARVAAKAAIRNSKTKRSFKNAIKQLHAALSKGDKKAAELQRSAQSELDKAVKKGVIHKNKAARKKRQLVKAAKTVSTEKPAKPAKTTKTAAKTAKPAAAKKPAAKKPASKAKK